MKQLATKRRKWITEWPSHLISFLQASTHTHTQTQSLLPLGIFTEFISTVPLVPSSLPSSYPPIASLWIRSQLHPSSQLFSSQAPLEFRPQDTCAPFIPALWPRMNPCPICLHGSMCATWPSCVRNYCCCKQYLYLTLKLFFFKLWDCYYCLFFSQGTNCGYKSPGISVLVPIWEFGEWRLAYF